ncbi:MAG: SGNH/GDSL hydrolase family protein [Verrucomicrobiaceae bacterium]|nr:SGNH/GDSL hydrolase family protein [Verrucomicrobiaceae bacterium]
MKTILCFGDSNTWGYDAAGTAATGVLQRHSPDARWPGVLARELGPDFRVIEEGQNGRTTVHDDPFSICRNGRNYLPACLESHKPLDVVVMMLGTNDLKTVFAASPAEIASCAAMLAKIILQSDAGIGWRPPQLLLISPPAVGDMSRAPDIAEKFADGAARSRRLPERYAAVAAQLGCDFLDAQRVVTPSGHDGIHLEAAEHEKLGKAVADAVRRMTCA